MLLALVQKMYDQVLFLFISKKSSVVYSVTYIGMERFLGKRYVAYLGTTSQKKTILFDILK